MLRVNFNTRVCKDLNFKIDEVPSLVHLYSFHTTPCAHATCIQVRFFWVTVCLFPPPPFPLCNILTFIAPLFPWMGFLDGHGLDILEGHLHIGCTLWYLVIFFVVDEQTLDSILFCFTRFMEDYERCQFNVFRMCKKLFRIEPMLGAVIKFSWEPFDVT